MAHTPTLREAAAVLAAAFHDGALFPWVQPDTHRRAAGLQRLFEGTLRHCRRFGRVEVVPGAEPEAPTSPAPDESTAADLVRDTGVMAPSDRRATGVGAVAGWVPARRLDLDPGDLLRSGLMGTPVWLGPRAMARLERHERPCERRLVALRRRHDAYLWVLGAEPSLRGQGLGHAALCAALDQMAEAGHRRCLLRTDDEPNVAWYQRQGFEVVEHLEGLPSRLPAWIMVRDLG